MFVLPKWRRPKRKTRAAFSGRQLRLDRAVGCAEPLEPRRLLSGVGFGAPIESSIPGGQGVPFAVAASQDSTELVVATDRGSIIALKSDGDGTFSHAATIYDSLPAGAGGPESLAIGPTGAVIALTNPQATGGVSVLERAHDGSFSLFTLLQVTVNSAPINALTLEAPEKILALNELSTADSDGTTALDPVLGTITGYAASHYSISSSALTEVAEADVDGDGATDIIYLSSDGTVSAILTDSRPSIPARTISAAGNQAIAITTADLNGDGYADLIVANRDGTVTTVLGGPNGFAATSRAYYAGPAPTGAVRLQVGDFNGDGKPDIFYTQQLNATSARSQILLGNGRGGLTTTGSSFVTPVLTTVADVNNDGYSDLVSTFTDPGTHTPAVSVQLNTTDVPLKFTGPTQANFAVGIGNSFHITGPFSAGSTVRILAGSSQSLPGSLSFHDNGNGTAVISGTPTAQDIGSYTIVVEASDGTDLPAHQTYTLTVQQAQAPIITSPNVASGFFINTFGTFTVTTNAAPTASISETGSLPSGFSFIDNGDGTATISGTFKTGAAGTYPLTIRASNGLGADAIQSLQLIITGPPQFTSVNHATFMAGVPGSFTVTAASETTPRFAFSGALPPGVSIKDNGDGTATLSGTPAAGSGGDYPLTIVASNQSGAPTQAFDLTVDEPPKIAATGQGTFIVGSQNTIAFKATGFPIPTLSEAGTLPAGLTFTASTDGTATISGVPTHGAGGIYTISINGANAVGAEATESVTLTVNEAPSISIPGGITFANGQSNTFIIHTSGFPTAALTLSGTLQKGISFKDNGNGTATLWGIPTGIGTVTQNLTITATNGVGAAVQDEFVLVTQPLAKPSFMAAQASTFSVGQAGSMAIATTGFPAPKITATSALPPGLSLVDNGTGTAMLCGTPTVGGTYKLTFTAANAKGIATIKLSLTMQVPATVTSAASAVFNARKRGSVTIKTSGNPVAAISFLGALPDGISFKDNGNGTATIFGTPTTAGEYILRIYANNGIGDPGTQTFTLRVD